MSQDPTPPPTPPNNPNIPPLHPGYSVGGMLLATDDDLPSVAPEPPASPPVPAPAAPPPEAAKKDPDAVGRFPGDAVRRALLLDQELNASVAKVPPWLRIPDGLRFPRGRKVRWMRIPARWTDTPTLGHAMPDLPGLWRELILWSLSPGDEQIAAERSLGNEQRFADELVKQSFRAIDGLPIDQTGRQTPQNVDVFWASLGAAGRGIVKQMWAALNNTTREQRTFFLAYCVGQFVAG